jgi:hypothetical protein
MAPVVVNGDDRTRDDVRGARALWPWRVIGRPPRHYRDLLILRCPGYTSSCNVDAREATRMTIANGLAERIHLTAAMLPARRAAA